MSLVEEAVRRLEQLRKAGAELEGAAIGGPAAAHGTPTRDPDIDPEILAGALRAEDAGLVAPAPYNTAIPLRSPGQRRSSRRVELDLKRLEAAGYVTPVSPRSQIADELRVIKRPLLDNVKAKAAGGDGNANRIMITSALPGEGKSFLAVNLAMSIAMELDSTVLLVDADVASRSVAEILGMPRAEGLMEVLTEPDRDLADVLIRTNVPKLSVLQAGSPHARATELLASEAMARLVEELATRYADRILIFDSPPLLVTTEARALASHMGQVVLVVEADRTTRGAVEQASAALEACPVVLSVLNKATQSDLGSYGYGYGYGAAKD
jgi:protein-tyrosine kinase